MNKELNLARMRFYFNSFSEMLIPTSVWEQTRNEKLEIFSCMEASEIKDIMVRYVSFFAFASSCSLAVQCV